MQRVPRLQSWILILVVLALGLAAGCGDDSPAPNIPPIVRWVERPDSGATLTDRAVFRWEGSDSDGMVAGWEYSMDSETSFTATADSTFIWVLTREDGTDSNPMAHVFRVRAIDERNLRSESEASSFVAAVFNDPPTVSFITAPDEDVDAGAMVDFEWAGSDPDGSILGYRYAFDLAGPWTETTETSLTIDFSTDTPVVSAPLFRTAHDPQPYTFYVEAEDNDNKRSEIVSSSFLAGPENVAPAVALTEQPTGTVDLEATWSWTVADADGSILRTQYAVDLTGDSDWTRWDSDTITLTFSREDGTPEAPQDHTFHLRTQDNDSTYSAVVVSPFTVAVPNQPPVVNFTQFPDPASLVVYRFTYKWEGFDDDGIVRYDYAVDDTTLWTATTEVEATIPFSTPNFDLGTCGAAGCLATGDHVFYLRAVDTEGLASAVRSSAIMAVNRSPVTSFEMPPGPDAVATVAVELDMTWSVRDVDGLMAPVGIERVVIPVGAFPDDPQSAIDAAGTWVELGSVTEGSLVFNSAGLYLVALRATDEAQSVEPLFTYDRNVLRMTVTD